MQKDHLYHSGIKGMRWGIRRFQNEDGSLTEEGKARYGKRSEKRPKPESATWKSKDARYLSDAELNRRNSRLQREEQYRRMTQSKMSKAGKWIAATAGTILVASAIGALKGRAQKNYKEILDKYGPKVMSFAKRKAASVSAAAIMAKNIKRG